MRSIKGYLDEWRVQEYLLITFFISWLSWGILILLTNLHVINFMSVLGVILFAIGGFGPTISAIMCIEGKLDLKKMLKFIFGHKKKTVGYILLYIILSIVIVWLSSQETNPEMVWYALPVVFLVCTFFGGGNEELGWRGTLQPLMEKILSKHIKNQALSFVVATLAVGAIWVIWHVPLWFVAGSQQQGMNFLWFALDALLLSFWLAALYRRTHSVFYCMILHGLTNVLMSFFVIKINWILIVGYLAMTVLSVALARGTAPKPVTEGE